MYICGSMEVHTCMWPVGLHGLNAAYAVSLNGVLAGQNNSASVTKTSRIAFQPQALPGKGEESLHYYVTVDPCPMHVRSS